MTTLTSAQMQDLEGEGFWGGFFCGASAAVLLGMALSPDPFTKLAWGVAWSTAAGTCGAALS